MLKDELTSKQRLAVLLRILGAQGYQDKTVGHITLVDRDDGSLLVNPGSCFWADVRAADVLRVTSTGQVLEGDGPFNPTSLFHFAVHEKRPDARVVIHNHPPFGTIWACSGELPPLLDQTAANGGGRAALCNEYEGALTFERGKAVAEALGDADMAILVNHGVLVTGGSEGLALVRALSFEWRCRMAYQVRAMGRAGVELPSAAAEELGQYAEGYGSSLFESYGLREVARDPSVLDDQ